MEGGKEEEEEEEEREEEEEEEEEEEGMTLLPVTSLQSILKMDLCYPDAKLDGPTPRYFQWPSPNHHNHKQ